MVRQSAQKGSMSEALRVDHELTATNFSTSGYAVARALLTHDDS